MSYTVHQIRRAGNKVKVEHKRKYKDLNTNRNLYLTDYDIECYQAECIINNIGLPILMGPDPMGGRTVVSITFKDGTDCVVTAECSKRDRYEKKIGVQTCLSRVDSNLLASHVAA